MLIESGLVNINWPNTEEITKFYLNAVVGVIELF